MTRKRLTKNGKAFADYTAEDWEAYKSDIKGKSRTYRQNNKKAVLARELVNTAIKLHLLQPPTTLKCVTCTNKAVVYHHPDGYEGAAALDVVPMCNSCHRLVHQDYDK